MERINAIGRELAELDAKLEPSSPEGCSTEDFLVMRNADVGRAAGQQGPAGGGATRGTLVVLLALAVSACATARNIRTASTLTSCPEETVRSIGRQPRDDTPGVESAEALEWYQGCGRSVACGNDEVCVPTDALPPTWLRFLPVRASTGPDSCAAPGDRVLVGGGGAEGGEQQQLNHDDRSYSGATSRGAFMRGAAPRS